MKTNRGYIVAMYNRTKRIAVISLEMWELIRNTKDYTLLYRTDNVKDAYNYVCELSSNIQKESTMVNKQEFIEKACEIAKDILSSYSFANYPHEMQDFLVDFRKAMEE
jgi:hypothetical protein